MKLTPCKQEKLFDRFFGLVFLLISSFFFAVSAAILPVFGLLVAFPILGISAAFFRHVPSEVCLLEK